MDPLGEMMRLMDDALGEDPEDRRVREAHGFTLDDDFQDPAVTCRACGLPYREISAGKIEPCAGLV
jgi:hypothetical protein